MTAGCSKTLLSTTADLTNAQPQQLLQIRSDISIIVDVTRTAVVAQRPLLLALKAQVGCLLGFTNTEGKKRLLT